MMRMMLSVRWWLFLGLLVAGSPQAMECPTQARVGLKAPVTVSEAIAVDIFCFIAQSLELTLDRFKLVNDVYGHDVGDEYLRQVASVLQSVCQYPDDEVIRYGGEEFLCVLPATPHDKACRLAEKARQAVLDLRCPNPSELGDYLTISVGVATSHVLPPDPHVLISAADEQLYAAKKAGRNRVLGTVVTL